MGWSPSDKTTPASAVELFAGGGLMSIALDVEGFATQHHCELDVSAATTIRRNLNPDAVSCDVREYHPEPVPGGLDVLVGGPPCQPWSQGGAQKGKDDPRNLWPEVLRLIGEAQPRVVMMENVHGILHQKHQEYLEWWWGEAAKLGYTGVIWKILGADYGSPQRRGRVWFVLFPYDAPWGARLLYPPPPTHTDPRNIEAGGRSQLLPWVRAFDQLNDGCCGGYGYSSCVNLGNLEGRCMGCLDGSSYEMATNEGGDEELSENAVKYLKKQESMAKHPPVDYGGVFAWKELKKGERRTTGTYLAPTVPKFKERSEHMYFATKVGSIGPRSTPAPAGGMLHCDIEEWIGELRTMSVREIAKLQSVPQWYTFYTEDGLSEDARTRTMKAQVGNGIDVCMGRAVARHVLTALGYTVPHPGSVAEEQALADEGAEAYPQGLWPLYRIGMCKELYGRAYLERYQATGEWIPEPLKARVLTPEQVELIIAGKDAGHPPSMQSQTPSAAPTAPVLKKLFGAFKGQALSKKLRSHLTPDERSRLDAAVTVLITVGPTGQPAIVAAMTDEAEAKRLLAGLNTNVRWLVEEVIPRIKAAATPEAPTAGKKAPTKGWYVWAEDEDGKWVQMHGPYPRKSTAQKIVQGFATDEAMDDFSVNMSTAKEVKKVYGPDSGIPSFSLRVLFAALSPMNQAHLETLLGVQFMSETVARPAPVGLPVPPGDVQPSQEPVTPPPIPEIHEEAQGIANEAQDIAQALNQTPEQTIRNLVEELKAAGAAEAAESVIEMMWPTDHRGEERFDADPHANEIDVLAHEMGDENVPGGLQRRVLEGLRNINQSHTLRRARSLILRARDLIESPLCKGREKAEAQAAIEVAVKSFMDAHALLGQASARGESDSAARRALRRSTEKIALAAAKAGRACGAGQITFAFPSDLTGTTVPSEPPPHVDPNTVIGVPLPGPLDPDIDTTEVTPLAPGVGEIVTILSAAKGVMSEAIILIKLNYPGWYEGASANGSRSVGLIEEAKRLFIREFIEDNPDLFVLRWTNAAPEYDALATKSGGLLGATVEINYDAPGVEGDVWRKVAIPFDRLDEQASAYIAQGAQVLTPEMYEAYAVQDNEPTPSNPPLEAGTGAELPSARFYIEEDGGVYLNEDAVDNIVYESTTLTNKPGTDDDNKPVTWVSNEFGTVGLREVAEDRYKVIGTNEEILGFLSELRVQGIAVSAGSVSLTTAIGSTTKTITVNSILQQIEAVQDLWVETASNLFDGVPYTYSSQIPKGSGVVYVTFRSPEDGSVIKVEASPQNGETAYTVSYTLVNESYMAQGTTPLSSYADPASILQDLAAQRDVALVGVIQSAEQITEVLEVGISAEAKDRVMRELLKEMHVAVDNIVAAGGLQWGPGHEEN